MVAQYLSPASDGTPGIIQVCLSLSSMLLRVSHHFRDWGSQACCPGTPNCAQSGLMQTVTLVLFSLQDESDILSLYSFWVPKEITLWSVLSHGLGHTFWICQTLKQLMSSFLSNISSLVHFFPSNQSNIVSFIFILETMSDCTAQAQIEFKHKIFD